MPPNGSHSHSHAGTWLRRLLHAGRCVTCTVTVTVLHEDFTATLKTNTNTAAMSIHPHVRVRVLGPYLDDTHGIPESARVAMMTLWSGLTLNVTFSQPCYTGYGYFAEDRFSVTAWRAHSIPLCSRARVSACGWGEAGKCKTPWVDRSERLPSQRASSSASTHRLHRPRHAHTHTMARTHAYYNITHTHTHTHTNPTRSRVAVLRMRTFLPGLGGRA